MKYKFTLTFTAVMTIVYFLLLQIIITGLPYNKYAETLRTKLLKNVTYFFTSKLRLS